MVLMHWNDGAALSEWWCCFVGIMVLLHWNGAVARRMVVRFGVLESWCGVLEK